MSEHETHAIYLTALKHAKADQAKTKRESFLIAPTQKAA